MDEALEQVLAGVIGQIWTSSRMYDDLTTLCNIGSRFAGTEGEEQARALVMQRLHDYGLRDVRHWEFDYLGWRRYHSSLWIVAPETQLLQAISLVGSPSTDHAGLDAEVINLGMGTRQDFERCAAEIPGRIVAVSSGSQPDTRAVHRREKYGWAVEHGAAGFVFINHLPEMPAMTGSLRPGRLGEIPAVSLSNSDGALLTRLTDQGTTRVLLDVQNTSGPATAQHVFADIPGKTDEVVVLSAHYDGHDISPSALDNGSGLVAVLELARLLAPHAGTFRRTIRIALWTVEEWGVYGSDRYLQTLSDEELASIALVVNLDITSGIGTPVWSLNGFSDLLPMFQRFAREMGYEYLLSEEITAGSDHFPFTMRGVPAVWLRGNIPADMSSRRYILTPLDTLDKVLHKDMKESAMVSAQILVRAANEPGRLARHLPRAETLAILREQGLEEPLRAQGKWPE